jgi:hypothetical protein
VTVPSGAKSAGWRQGEPKLVASRTPLHAPAGAGGRKRRAPVGGAAYGIPRHSSADPVEIPSSAPLGVSTIGPVARAGAAATQAHANANNPANVTRRMRAHYADVEPISRRWPVASSIEG